MWCSLLISTALLTIEQEGNSLFYAFASKGAQDIYVAEVMIEGNATLDVSAFVSEMIMPVTATTTIVDAEIIGRKHDPEIFTFLLF